MNPEHAFSRRFRKQPPDVSQCIAPTLDLRVLCDLGG